MTFGQSKRFGNKPGEPIVDRSRGAYFYCLDCGKEYRQCKCKVYVSADTLKRGKNIGLKRGKGHRAN